MFAAFLIGTVLVTSLVMVYLLILPTDRRPFPYSRQTVPLLGAGALAVAIMVAAVAGLAVSG